MSGPKDVNIYNLNSEAIARMEAERNRQKLIRSFNSKKNSVLSLLPEIMNQLDKLTTISAKSGFKTCISCEKFRQSAEELQKTVYSIKVANSAPVSTVESRRRELDSAADSIRQVWKQVADEQSRINHLYEQKLLRISNLRKCVGEIKVQIDEELKKHADLLEEVMNRMQEYGISSSSLVNDIYEFHMQSMQTAPQLCKSLGTDARKDEEQYLADSLSLYRGFKEKIDTFPSRCEEVKEQLKAQYLNTLSDEISGLLQQIREKEKQEAAKRKAEADRQEQERKQQLEEREKILAELHERVTGKFDALEQSGSMQDKTREKLADLRSMWQENMEANIDNLEYMRQFYALSIDPKIKQLKDEIEDYQDLLKRYNEAYDQYVVLCNELNEEPGNFAMSEEGINHIYAQMFRLEDYLYDDYNNRYISRSIDEVMKEMGYDVIGYSVEHERGYGHEALYRFNDSSAISVCMTDNYLTIELGGIDDTDREPDEAEAREQVEDMKKFCSDYKIIQEKLKSKGLELKDGHDLPPDLEYGQIHNLRDYDIDDETIEDLLNRAHAGRRAHAGQAAAEEQKHLTADE